MDNNVTWESYLTAYALVSISKLSLVGSNEAMVLLALGMQEKLQVHGQACHGLKWHKMWKFDQVIELPAHVHD